MKIFITGATGYIGERIALYFAGQGHTINALIRTPQKAEKLHHPNITFITGDISQPDALENAAQGCDICIHAAAFSAVFTRDKHLYDTINVDGTKLVYQAARKSGIKKFIYISSAGIFGPGNNVTETTIRRQGFFNDYERTKSIASEWLFKQNSPEMPIVSLNLTRVYGPGQLTESNAGTRLIERVVNGSWKIIPGNGKSIGNYVFIDDIPIACHKAIENGRGGECYLIGGENLSFNRYFKTIKEISGANQKMVKIPVWFINAIAHAMQFMAWFGVTPVITPQWARRYFYNWKIDTTKAEKELGIEPTPFYEGAKKTVKWLLKKDNQTADIEKEVKIEH